MDGSGMSPCRRCFGDGCTYMLGGRSIDQYTSTTEDDWRLGRTLRGFHSASNVLPPQRMRGNNDI